MTTTTPQQHNAQESQTPALGERIARLKNEELLKMIKAVDALHSNIDSTSFWLLLSEDQKHNQHALLKEVKAIKDALNREYGTRLLRGYHSQFKQLLAALQPRPHGQGDTGGLKIIPLRAATAQEEQEEDAQPQQEDALQAAITVFAEQLRTILLAGGSAEGRHADDSSAPPQQEAQQP